MMTNLSPVQIFFEIRNNCSRPFSEDLVRSIQQFGILDALIAIEEDGENVLLCGHNRLRAATVADCRAVPVQILPSFDFQQFAASIAKKLSNNTITSAGVLRALTIVDRYSPQNSETFAAYFCRGINTTAVINSGVVVDEIFFSFLNSRKAPAKQIVQLSLLDPLVRDHLRTLISRSDFSLGSFRHLIELTDEICRRDASLPLPGVMTAEGRVQESEIIDFYFGRRYPSFSEKTKRFEKLQKNIQKKGIRLSAPLNFEGNFLDLTLRISAAETKELLNEDCGYIAEKFDLLSSFLRT